LWITHHLLGCHPEQQRNWPGIKVSMQQSY
jgi:hypothetical protein